VNYTSAAADLKAAPTLAEMAQALELHRATFGVPPGPQEVTRAEWDALKKLLAPYTAYSNAQGLPDSFMGVRVVLKD
jgi:hypothetical protein